MTTMETFLRSFVGGEVSPLMRGRVDDPQVQSGLKLSRNFIIQPQGPAQRRPGFEHVARSKFSSSKSRLVPFRFSTTQALVVQIGVQHFRFYAEGRPLVHAVGLQASSVDPATERIVFTGEHGFVQDQQVRVIAMGGGTQPGGLSDVITYFVRFIDPRQIEVSLTAGGAAVDITSAGAGAIFVFEAATVPLTYVQSRSPIAVDPGAAESMTFIAAHNLLTGDNIVFVGSEVASALGLVVGQEYFAIKIDSVTIQVASTRANALAFVNLNLLAAPGTLANVRMRRNYGAGELVYLADTGNGFYYCITGPAGDPNPAVDNNPPTATDFWYAMPDDGTFELPNPYVETNLPQVKYDQKFDTLGLAHEDHILRDLVRFGATFWRLNQVSFAPTLPAPTGVAVAVTRGAGISARSITIANPAVIVTGDVIAATDAEHGLSTGEVVLLKGTLGDLGSIPVDTLYRVQRVDVIRIILVNKDTGVTLGSSSATVNAGARLFPTSLAAENQQSYVVAAVDERGNLSELAAPVSATNNLGTSGSSNLVTWNAVAGAVRYRVFKDKNGLFGFLGDTEELSFKDDNIDADLKLTLPIQDTSLSGSDYPGTIGRFDQRRTLAATRLFPQRTWMTKPGTENDLTLSVPVVDSDRIQFDVDSSELSQIRHIVGKNHLMLLASDGEYRVTPLNSDVITPETVAVRQQSSVGCSHVRPLSISNTVLFHADRGGHVYKISFEQASNGFKPDDLCLRASHLFDGLDLVDSAYSKAPYPMVFWPSTDGGLRVMTYVPAQSVEPWYRFETDGVVESVCVIPEGTEDRLYAEVLRTVNGAEVRTVERMGTVTQLTSPQLEDAFFVDAGLTFDGRNAGSTTVQVTNGRSWAADETLTLVASQPLFQLAAGDVGDQVVLTAANGARTRLTIISVTSTLEARVRTDVRVPAEFRGVATTSWGFARDTFSGLSHLEGVTVQILAEGVVLPPQVVTSATITLPSPRMVVHIGRPCPARLETQPLVLPIEGFGKGRSLNPSRTVVSVFQAAPFRMGPDDSTLVTVGRVELQGMQTLDVEETLKGRWSPGGELVIEQADPLPLTVVGVALDVAIGGQP